MTRMDILEGIIKQRIDYEIHFSGIEIGCYEGEFAKEMLGIFKYLYLTSIDPSPKLENIYSGIEWNENRFTLLVDTSDNAIRYLKRDYDFVFIDGNHSYEQTRRDILNYWQVIKKGGFISGHNYSDRGSGRDAHPGVQQAVREIFGDRFNLNEEDATWWVEL